MTAGSAILFVLGLSSASHATESTPAQNDGPQSDDPASAPALAPRLGRAVTMDQLDPTSVVASQAAILGLSFGSYALAGGVGVAIWNRALPVNGTGFVAYALTLAALPAVASLGALAVLTAVETSKDGVLGAASVAAGAGLASLPALATTAMLISSGVLLGFFARPNPRSDQINEPFQSFSNLALLGAATSYATLPLAVATGAFWGSLASRSGFAESLVATRLRSDNRE